MAIRDRLITVNPYNKEYLMNYRGLFGVQDPQLAGLMQGIYDNYKPQGVSVAVTPQLAGVNTTMAAAPQHKGAVMQAKINNLAQNLGSGVSNIVGGMANQLALKGISGGLDSGAGNGIANAGNAIGGAVGQFNPVAGAIIQAGTGIIGGGINALAGTAVNQERLNAANAGTTQLNSFVSDAEDLDNVKGPQAVAEVQDAYRGGVFKKGWARRRNDALRQQRADALAFADRSVTNNVNNILADQMSDALANYSAFGGPLGGMAVVQPYTEQNNDDGMGAIEYGFMSDYLLNKKKQVENQDKMKGGLVGGLMEKHNEQWPLFALGGDLQSHGGDYSSGLMHVDAGRLHEENAYGGVQVGVDGEGVPNLVEEGETVYDDYVFSNRIEVPKEVQKWLGVKGRNLTFAEASKQLEKEIKERPNDPVSRAALKAQMERLEEEQEFVKRCTSYSVGEVYDVDNNEMSLLNHNGYEYEKLG